MKRKETKVGWKNNIDKLLFIIASFYLISTLTWLWKYQKQVSIANGNLITTPVNAENNAENNPNSQQSSSETDVLTSQSNQPTINSLKEGLFEAIGFSGNNPNIPPPLPELPTSELQSSLPLPPISIPEPPPMSPPVSAIPITTPPRPQPQRNSTPAVKVNKVPVLDNPSQKNIISVNPSQNSSPSYEIKGDVGNKNNVLLGTIELENSKSIALFNINNLTEKVEIGTEIGTTGWFLVGINGKQAIINRQNQSLYLTVGEKF